MNKLRYACAVMGLLAGIAGGAASAEPYPSHAVTFITPFAAGGPTDVIARVTAKRLSERLGQPVVVQNVLGGGGVIGTEQAANAKPDCYTLYLAVNSLAIYPSVQPPERPLPFDPVKSFKAIGGIATSAHVIVVGPDLGVKTLAELVDMARKNPEKISYGSAGVGGTTHLPMAFLAHTAGVKMLHVPYKGAAPALTDTMAGRVSVAAPGYSGTLHAQIQEGKLIPLAVTSAKRLPFLPNVPTMVESGYPDLVFPIWYALFAPRDTPDEITKRLSSELQAMSKEPEFVEMLYKQGNIAEFVAPADMTALVARDVKLISDRIKAAKIDVIER